MLHEFLANNRDSLIERCRAKVAQRPARAATPDQLQNGVPKFLEQLINTLKVEQTRTPMDSRKISGPASGTASLSEVGEVAALHGRDLLNLGYTVDQVVHDYGDLCQAITDLAFERDAPFEVDEFRTLNRCLDNAIAGAVSEFSYHRENLLVEKQAAAANEKIGFLIHEMRDLLNTATLAVAAGKAGNLNFAGATGAVLERSLFGLRDLIDQSVSDVRSAVNDSGGSRLFSAAEFVSEVAFAARLVAQVRGCHLIVSDVSPALGITGNRGLLYSALGNLLQNAFKFTQHQTEVHLDVHAVSDRIFIDVSDHCGGLPPGETEIMFAPFKQQSGDRTGLGLGLAIARQSIERDGGTLGVRDVPGVGCIFTISLPRYEMQTHNE